jgi:hypothetical protein
MPKTKNQAKNKSRFEVRGGVINEFEFASNEGAMTEEEHQRFLRQEEERRLEEGAAADASPQTEAERIRQLMSNVREKVAASDKRGGKKGAAAGAKKAGAAGAAKKGVAKKAGAKKPAPHAKKSAAKKSGARKSATSAARKTGRAR